MEEKLNIIKQRFIELSDLIIQPDIISDQKKYVKISKEYKDLKEIVDKINEYNTVKENIHEAEEILKSESDKEMIELASSELSSNKDLINEIEEDLKIMLIPKDPDDSKNIVMAGDLFRMYSKFAEKRGWKVNIVDLNEGTAGGFKEIIIEINGENVYGTLKFESGVHRVQRVPQTETQGRVHTSAATVMVLPEAEEFDVELNMQEVRIERTTSTGPGGQSVNTTYSAIKLHHEPTGLIVSCQDQKSQHKNLEKALKVLRTRLYELELSKKLEEDSQKRSLMVSSGDRSAKIRTYNYPQGRVTDHRINLTLYDLQNIVNGDIEKLIDELKVAQNTELMKNENENL